MESMGMTDKQFNFFLRSMIRDLEEIQQALKNNDKEKAEEKIKENIEDLQKSLED